MFFITSVQSRHSYNLIRIDPGWSIIVPDSLSILIQHLLPKQALTEFGAHIANAKAGRITTGIIRWFVKKYGVNMDEALNPDIASYASFNEFFTRPLKPNARPLADSDFVCPVDGAISQCGAIENNQIFQAKGHNFSTTDLVGGDQALADQFTNGSFANIYLSPKDYHRIHMPCAGRLMRMIYIPGALFSVNPVTARGVPNLFARNERVVCVFESKHGPFALVLVGATIVGSMATTWHGVVNSPRIKQIRAWDYAGQDIRLNKGEEMGRFLLGSTVVLLFPKQTLTFNQAWQPTDAVRLGTEMGNIENLPFK
jgi:phosphatidylserine decarboxylase